MKQWFVSELQESLGKSTHDVQMVLDYLAQRGDVDMRNVGMFGVGAGATIAVAAASVDQRIKAIDLLDPWGDWPVWTAASDVIPDEERPAYTKDEFLKKVAAFDPVRLLPNLKTPHIRLVQLNEDFGSTPEEAKKRMEASLPASGERHRYESNVEYYGALASGGRAFDWIKHQLQGADFKMAAGKADSTVTSHEPKQEPLDK
jgi:acetyl esterase/lipase